MRRILPTAVLLFASGCGAQAQPPPEPPKQKPTGPVEGRLVTPGRLVRFPVCDECTFTARVDLGKDGCLDLTSTGDRWLSPKCGDPPTAAASQRAPVRIVGAGTIGKQRAFAGADGSLHLADSLLGDFTLHVKPPPAKIRSTAVGDGFAIAFGPAGGWRYSEDDGWKPVVKTSEHVRSVAALGAAVLALESPERLFLSEDAGKTFAAAARPTHGATSVLSWHGALIAPGRSGASEWKPGPGFRDAPVFEVPAVSGEASAFPSASIDGAVAIGSTDLVAVSRSGEGVRILSGPIAGPFREEKPGNVTECEPLVVAMAEPNVALGCGRDDELLVYLREGTGKTLEIGRVGIGKGSKVGLAVSSTGVVLVTAACPRSRSCDGGVARLVKGKAPTFATPGVVSSARGAFSRDGSLAYAIGTTEDDKVALFVSRDAGASWVAKPVGTVKLKNEWEEDSEDGNAEYDATPTLDPDGALGVSDEGDVGTSLLDDMYGNRVWFTFDAEGRVRSHTQAATGYQGWGRRVLRFSMDVGDFDVRTKVHESEGGADDWTAVDVGVDEPGALPTLVCGRAGCLVPGVGVRVGWGPGERAGSDPVPEPPPAPAAIRPAPIVCEPVPKKKWSPIKATEAPTIEDVAIGSALWVAVQADTGVALTLAKVDAKGAARVSSKVLLAGGAKGAKLKLIRGCDGYVAVRSRTGGGAEIAWEHLGAETAGRHTLAKGDLETASLAPDGSALLQTTEGQLVVIGKGANKTFPIPADWRGSPVSSTLAGGTPILHRTAQPFGPLVVETRPLGPGGEARMVGIAEDGAWTVQSLGEVRFGKDAALSFGLDEGPVLFASRLRADGRLDPFDALPRLGALGATPRGCSAPERAQTPRLGVKLEPWLRWIQLAGKVDSDDLDGWGESALVVQGTASSPCVAAHVAAVDERTAVVDGDGKVGFLIELAPKPRFLPLSCKADPSLTPPIDGHHHRRRRHVHKHGP